MMPRDRGPARLAPTIADIEEDRRLSIAARKEQRAAELANDLGVMHYLAGQYPEARAALQSARDAFERLDSPIGRARAAGNLARLEERSGNRAAALRLYREAADLFEQHGNAEDEFATLRALSRVYLRIGGWLQALATFDRALACKPGRGLWEALLRRLYQIPLRMLGLNYA